MGQRERVTVWFSGAEHAIVDAAASSVGVETGALVREASLRAAAAVARDVSEGRVKLRRRSASAVPVQLASAASASGEASAAFGRREGAEGARGVVAVERGPARAPASPRELSAADRTALFRAATQGRRSS